MEDLIRRRPEHARELVAQSHFSEDVRGRCSICYEENQLLKLDECNHGTDGLLCRSCMCEYLRERLDDIDNFANSNPQCPHPQCHVEIMPNVADYVLEADASFRYLEFTLRKRVGYMVACPLCDTTLIAEDEGSVHGQPVVCATCVPSRRVCIDCRCAWHQGETCAQYQQRIRLEAQDREMAAARANEARLRELAAQEAADREERERRQREEEANAEFLRGVKQCPSCGMGIVHYRGHRCHHMKCRCGSHFCYVCLGPYGRCGCGYQGSTFCRPCPGNPPLRPGQRDCGCRPCPDCRPGSPCSLCDGCPECEPNLVDHIALAL